MAEPMTAADILAKMECEGGWEAVFLWGLKPEDSDDPGIQTLIRNARDYYDAFESACGTLEASLEATAEPEVLRDEC